MLASSVVLGTLAGLLLRGDWRNLRTLRIHWWQLALVAFGIRIVGVLFALDVAAYAVAILLSAVIAARNVHLRGAALVALGSSLNAAVVLLNGGMPVDQAAAAAVSAQTVLNDALHIPLDEHTRLPWLADVLPFPLFRSVYSFGDVLIAAGGFLLPFSALRRA